MLPFWISIGFLSLVQGVLVGLPRPTVKIPLLDRYGGRWWALVLPLSIVVVIGGIALDEASAHFLTWLALIAVPPLAAVALGWIVHGARPPLALLAVPLFALAWAAKGELGGQSAALALSALACVTLGWLLVCVVPARWVKLGIYAMAIIDAYLVFTDLLQAPNSGPQHARRRPDLPKLQLVDWGAALMGFGDLFIAAVLGALLARDGRLQLRGALLAATLCCAWDLLFFFIHETPATVPSPSPCSRSSSGVGGNVGARSEVRREEGEDGAEAGEHHRAHRDEPDDHRMLKTIDATVQAIHRTLETVHRRFQIVESLIAPSRSHRLHGKDGRDPKRNCGAQKVPIVCQSAGRSRPR